VPYSTVLHKFGRQALEKHTEAKDLLENIQKLSSSAYPPKSRTQECASAAVPVIGSDRILCGLSIRSALKLTRPVVGRPVPPRVSAGRMRVGSSPSRESRKPAQRILAGIAGSTRSARPCCRSIRRSLPFTEILPRMLPHRRAAESAQAATMCVAVILALVRSAGRTQLR
jgi:hypothetical protein